MTKRFKELPEDLLQRIETSDNLGEEIQKLSKESGIPEHYIIAQWLSKDT